MAEGVETCPKCGAAMELKASASRLKDDDTVETKERWKCPTCGTVVNVTK